jgi:electron transfer flavoprotein alpha subunit
VGRKKVCGSNLDWERIITFPAALTIPRRTVSFSGGLSKPEKITERPMSLSALPRWLLSYEPLEPFAANPLESARLVFAGGRGLGSVALTERLRRLAFRYGAALGLSRPAALNGWGKTGDIIGQSGVRTQAECCLAVGVSGAAAFMTGIESSACLIAVNTDAHAPVFHYADMGIIAGAEEFIAALETAAE